MKNSKIPWLSLFPIFLVLYEFTVYMSNDLIMPGMMTVVNSFQANHNLIPISLSLFLLGGCALQLFVGPLSDHWGKRIVLLWGVTFFLFATLFISGSLSMTAFLTGRFFQGMGLCFIQTTGYAILHELYSETKAIRLMSLMAVVALLAPLIGPVLGGVIIEYCNWRFIFIFICLLTIISLVGLFFSTPNTARFKHSFKSLLVLYWKLLKDKKFLCGVCALGLFETPILCWISASPLILEKKYHLSGMMFGNIQIPLFSGLIISNLLLNHLAKTVASIKLIFLGLIICLFGAILAVATTWFLPPHFLNLIIPLAIYSVGLGFLTAPLQRKILFSSCAPKGILSGLSSLGVSSILVSTTALMSYVYRAADDFSFACFAAGCTILASILFYIFSYKNSATA